MAIFGAGDVVQRQQMPSMGEGLGPAPEPPLSPLPNAPSEAQMDSLSHFTGGAIIYEQQDQFSITRKVCVTNSPLLGVK